MLIFHFVDTRKTRDPNFGGVSNLKFFCTINIKEMAAIFQFFHNGQHWYSVSINTQKTGDPNFGGVGHLNFFHTINIKEMAAIFQFFHNGWHWYFINTGKTGHVNFLWVQFSKFLVGSVFPITHPRFHSNITAWLHLKHFCVVTFLHSENWRHKFPSIQFSKLFCWFSFPCHPS